MSSRSSEPPRRRGASFAIAALLLATQVAWLTGCGGSSSPTATPSTAPTPRVASSPKAASSPAPASAQPYDLSVAVAAFDSAYAPFFVAINKGYYKDFGLNVTLDHASGSLATPQLVAGKLGISTSSASAMDAILRGFPLKEILTNINHPAYWLVGQPSIKSVADLKGKRIGIQGHGDTTELATDVVLSRAGIQPDQVVYEVLGRQGPAYLAALQSGQLQADVMTPQVYTLPAVKQALATGKLRIISNYGHAVELMMTGAATSDSLIQQHPAVVEHFVQATLRGLQYTMDKANEADVMKIVISTNKKFHSPIPARQLKTDLGIWVQYMNPRGDMPAAAEKQDIALTARAIKAKSMPVSKVFDDSFAQQAAKALGITGNGAG